MVVNELNFLKDPLSTLTNKSKPCETAELSVVKGNPPVKKDLALNDVRDVRKITKRKFCSVMWAGQQSFNNAVIHNNSVHLV